MAQGVQLTGRQIYICRRMLFEAVGGSADAWAELRQRVSGYDGPRAGVIDPAEVDDTLRLLMLADPGRAEDPVLPVLAAVPGDR
jgi:hypothetical protein